jgi:hypothetical protein
MSMKKNFLLLLCLTTGILLPSAAHAQACLGLPSFTSGSVHLNLAAEFPEAAKAYAAGIGAGKPNSLFANLGVGQVTFDEIEEKSTYGFLEFGYQFPVSRAQVCPIAGGSFASGPDDEAAGIKVSSSAASGGLALGVPLGSDAFQVIPNVAVKYTHLTQKVEDEAGTTSESFDSGVVDLGLGFVFRDRLSIQPLFHIPFAGDDDETSFGFFASVSFGWRGR